MAFRSCRFARRPGFGGAGAARAVSVRPSAPDAAQLSFSPHHHPCLSRISELTLRGTYSTRRANLAPSSALHCSMWLTPPTGLNCTAKAVLRLILQVLERHSGGGMPVQQVRDDFARRLGRALEDGSFQMLRLAHGLSNLSAVDEPLNVNDRTDFHASGTHSRLLSSIEQRKSRHPG